MASIRLTESLFPPEVFSAPDVLVTNDDADQSSSSAIPASADWKARETPRELKFQPDAPDLDSAVSANIGPIIQFQPADDEIAQIPHEIQSSREFSSAKGSQPPHRVADQHPIVASSLSVQHWREHWYVVASGIAMTTWIVGGVAIGVVQLRRIVRQWQFVRRATVPPDHLTAEVGRLAKAMDVLPLPVLVAPSMASPFVWCLGRLRLLWPESLCSRLDVSRCRGVIAHELAHVRRRDHWVAWLELSATVIWWWNPLFWYARRQLRETAELACDAVALAVLPDSRREYAEMFLELSSARQPNMPVPVLGVSTGFHRTFERRLQMILSENLISKLSWRGLLFVGMLALVTLPSWSWGQAPPQLPPQVPQTPNNRLPPAIEPSESPPQARSENLENRVQRLEEKLDQILKELQKLNTASTTRSGGTLGGFGGFGGFSRLSSPNRTAGTDASSRAPVVRAESPDGKVITVIDDGEILFLDQATRKSLFRFAFGAAEKVHSLVFSPDGKTLFAQTPNSIIAIDVATGKIVQQHETGSGAEAKRNDDSNPVVTVTIRLQHQSPDEVEAVLKKLTFPNSKITTMGASNSLVVAAPRSELSVVTDLIKELDTQPSSTGQPVLRSSFAADEDNALVPARDNSLLSPRPSSSPQIDIVALGTAIIEARGALRLAQAQHERFSRLKATASVSSDEVESAAIRFETAQQKLDLLTNIARTALDSAKADLQSAHATLDHSKKMFDKGYITSSQSAQIQAKTVTAEANLKLIESILNPPPRERK